jgi:alpha-tubulin suppressor-like RCC1 family protein
LNNLTPQPRARELARVASLMSLVAALGACSDGDSPPPPPSPSPPPSVAAKVNLAAPSDGHFPWRIAQPLSLTLVDGSGQAVAASATTCVAQDTTTLAVSADCTRVTALRIGGARIDVSGGGASASLIVEGVPQRQWTGVHGVSRYAAATIDGDGNAFAWGDNTDGILLQQLDSATLASLAVAAPMLGLLSLPINAASQVTIGEKTAALVAFDGRPSSWGNNGFDQLGAGVTAATSLVDVPLLDLTGHATLQHVAQLEIGQQNGVALIDDGSVVGWSSYPGNGTSATRSPPVSVLGPGGTAPLAHVAAVSAGWNYTLALTDDGHVVAWGLDSSNGVLGGNAVIDGVAQVPGYVLESDGTALTGIVQISAGYDFALALAADGSVWAWGNNAWGQLGRPTIGGASGAAVQVQGPAGGTLGGISMVAAGGNHALALDATGRVLAWGYAPDGALGDGAARPVVNQTAVPRVVVDESGGIGGFTDIVSIAAGFADSYALGRDGRVLSWGSNFHGALARATTGATDNTPGRTTTATGMQSLPVAAYPNLTRHAR